jgi:hypothetical protein
MSRNRQDTIVFAAVAALWLALCAAAWLLFAPPVDGAFNVRHSSAQQEVPHARP